MRKERAFKYSNPDMNNSTLNVSRTDFDMVNISSNLSFKQKVILNTIEDLQRTLEYQSVELNNIHAENNYT